MLQKFTWYYQRARKFTPTELLFRVQEQLKRQQENVSRYLINPLPQGKLLTQYLQGQDPAQLLQNYPKGFHFETPQAMHESFADCLPHRLQKAEQELNNYLAGNFILFDEPVTLSRPIPYRRDWHTQHQWSTKHWSLIDYRWVEPETDIRRLWELNRLHTLVMPASLAAATNHTPALIQLAQDLMNWLVENPPLQGPNWASSLELGIRLVSFSWLRIFLGETLAQEPQSAEAFLGTVWLHVHQLLRYPSRHSSMGNHAIGEALGLYIAGTFFPEFQDASHWRTEGKTILDEQGIRQILPKGGSVEQTTSYLRFVLAFYTNYLSLARMAGESVPQTVTDRLVEGFTALANLLPAQGDMPLIGDNDDGAVLLFGDTIKRRSRTLLATGSLLLNKPNLGAMAGISKPDERSFWLIGPSVKEKWFTLQQTFPMATQEVKDLDGITVLQSASQMGSLMVTFRAGNFGMAPNYGHAHADLLSITLSTLSGLFLLDPGNYLYFGALEWRQHFRSVRAHNTFQVDNFEQAQQAGAFLWEKPPQTHLTTSQNNQCTGTVQWLTDAGIIRQTRSLTLDQTNDLLITDTAQLAGAHQLSWFWLIHPAWQLQITEPHIIVAIKGGITIQLISESKLPWQLSKGTAGSKDGWYAPQFNKLEPCWFAQSNTSFTDEGTWQTRFKMDVTLGLGGLRNLS